MVPIPLLLSPPSKPRQNYAGEIWRRRFQSVNASNFSVYTTLEKFENVTITGHFIFVFEENSSRENKLYDYRDVIFFEKLCFQNVFRPHWNAKPAFSNSSGLKSVLEKLRFCDGLAWTVALTVEIKLRFQISPA